MQARQGRLVFVFKALRQLKVRSVYESLVRKCPCPPDLQRYAVPPYHPFGGVMQLAFSGYCYSSLCGNEKIIFFGGVTEKTIEL